MREDTMHIDHDPPSIAQLAAWCLNRVPGRETRHRRMRAMMNEFADLFPEELPVITVAGTSGKGTTCTLLESVLSADGHVTGVCTKPHLLSFRERIRIGGESISHAELVEHAGVISGRLVEFVRKHGASFHPSLFEALLLIAASVFRQRGVTIAVFEAAVGGANDAASLLPARLSIVTSVDLDHQNELGDSIEAIARDKAGIAVPGTILVSGAGMSGTARSAVAAECARRSVQCVQATADDIEVVSETVRGQTLRFSEGGEVRSVFLPFAGRQQVLNFATVRMATRTMHELGLIQSTDSIRGVERAHLPGRFEFIDGSPSWLFDVAHNTASIETLISTASRFFPKERIVVILGATEPHAYQDFVKRMCAWGVRVCFCAGFTKAVALPKLAAEVPDPSQILGQFETPAAAVGFLLNARPLADSILVVTGSLFLVGQCRYELAQRGLLAGSEV
jgi:folylpolyglutamate synthase/dihydrofolate synthase